MELVIVACQSSAMEHFLFSNPELGAKLISYVLEETAQLRPERVRGLTLSGREAAFRAAGIDPLVLSKPVEKSGKAVITQVSTLLANEPTAQNPNNFVLMVAPGLGPVLLSRMRDVVEAAQEGAWTSVYTSALPVPANCNPAWLHAVSSSEVTGEVIRLSGQVDTRCGEPFCDAYGAPVRFEGQPKGSQWLPPLWHVDGAVTYFCPSEIGRGSCCIFSRLDGPRPMLYELPLFQFEDNQTINWPLKTEDIDLIFTIVRKPMPMAAT